MSDEDLYNFPEPSDKELSLGWLALKPGNYKKQSKLLEHTAPLLDDENLKTPVPMGVGDYSSVVYIYPQGTIEIIGNVYCWNKLLKPGIYSVFEKLRYKDGTIVNDRNKDVNYHHASYNKQPIEDNLFSRIRVTEQEHIAEYKYVSFNNQITTELGDKVYPVPILDGTITIYPDGTFKTKNIVLNSDTGELIDPYGYLNDQNYYNGLKLFYNNFDKGVGDGSDVISHVYKHISNNEDGSVTYGANEQNNNLTLRRIIPLPIGIIPVNDGSVEITSHGYMTLQGLVLSTEGYRIKTPYLHVSQLYTKNEENELVINEDILDLTTKYYPVIDTIGESEEENTLSMITDIGRGYRYHPDNDTYTVYTDDDKNVKSVKYTPMMGWNNFKPYNDNGLYNIVDDLFYLGHLNDNGNSLVTSYYPFIEYYRFEYGNGFIYPKVRFDPNFMINAYITVDHNIFYNHPEKARGFNQKYILLNIDEDIYETNTVDDVIISMKTDSSDQNNLMEYLPKDFIYTSYESGTIDKFVPYLTLREDELGYNTDSNYIIEDIDDQLYFKSHGNVIWKRNNEYFTLDTEPTDTTYNQVFYNTSWPDIKTDDNGHPVSLYTVDGYFTDEPIFIRKGHGQGYPWHDNNENNSTDKKLSPLNIDGVKRQETGLFKLVKRNVTHYLTDLEKQLIDNFKLPIVVNYIDENYKIQRIEAVEKGKHVRYSSNYGYFSSHDTDIYSGNYYPITLEYYTFRFNEITPASFDPTALYFKTDYHLNKLDNYLNIHYDRDQEKLYHDFRVNEDRIKLTTSNLISNSDIFKYTNTDRYRRINNKSIKQYLIDKDDTLSSLKNEDENNEDYRKLNNIIIDGSAGYSSRPKFTVPETHCLEDGPIYINLEKGNINLKYLYWRTNESTLTYQGHVDVLGTNRGVFEINNVTLKQRTGYLDIWYDDPFNEKSGYTIKRIKLLKNKIPVPITIDNEDDITNRTTIIRGTSNTNAKLYLYRKDDLNNPIVITNSNSDGIWKIELIDDTRLVVGDVYVIKQIDSWGIVNTTEFIPKKALFKENDLITINELAGLNKYLYPVNLKNLNNLLPDLNLVDSYISFDLNNQSYTIEGIVTDEDGNIYPEGTYEFGTAPVSYKSNVLSIEDKVFTSHVNKNGKHYYRIKQDVPYTAKNTLFEERTHYNLAELRHELWILPEKWLAELKSIPESANESFDNDLHYHVYKSLKERKVYGTASISRYQNKLIFDEITELYLPKVSNVVVNDENNINNDNDIFRIITIIQNPSKDTFSPYPIYGYENNLRDGFVKNGFNAINFYNYIEEVDNTNYPLFPYSNINKRIKNPLDLNESFLIRVKDIREHVNPANPVNRYIHVFKPSPNGKFVDIINNKKIKLPYWYSNIDYQLGIFNIYNNKVIVNHLHDPNNGLYLRYAVDYSYTLRSNYNELPENERMDSDTYNYWVGKGFNLEMFEFNKWTTGSYITFSKEGNSISIKGRIKIGNKYTINKGHIASTPNDFKYSPYSPEYLLPEEGYGSFEWLDDDKYRIRGLVYAKNIDNNHNVIPTEGRNYLIPRFKQDDKYGIDLIADYPATEAYRANVVDRNNGEANKIIIHIENVHNDLLSKVGVLIVNQSSHLNDIVEIRNVGKISDFRNRRERVLYYTLRHYDEKDYINYNKPRVPYPNISMEIINKDNDVLFHQNDESKLGYNDIRLTIDFQELPSGLPTNNGILHRLEDIKLKDNNLKGYRGWSDNIPPYGRLSTHFYLYYNGSHIYDRRSSNYLIIDEPRYFIIDNPYTYNLEDGDDYDEDA